MLKLCCSIAHHRALGMMPAARSRRSPSCSPCAHGGCGPPTLSTQRAVASATHGIALHCAGTGRLGCLSPWEVSCWVSENSRIRNVPSAWKLAAAALQRHVRALSALVSDPSAATDEASSLAHELTDRMQRLERTVQQSERARAAEAEAGALEKKLEERDAQMLFMLDQLRHTKAELDVAHKELGEDRDHLLKLQSRGWSIAHAMRSKNQPSSASNGAFAEWRVTTLCVKTIQQEQTGHGAL